MIDFIETTLIGTNIMPLSVQNNNENQPKGDFAMSNKIMGITKSAITGAVFGSVIGMVSAPSKPKKKRNVVKDISGTLKIMGNAMQDVSNLLRH